MNPTIGKPGQKYGLIIRKKQKKEQPSLSAHGARIHGVFGVKNEVTSVKKSNVSSTKPRSKKTKFALMHKKALEEDASVFEYDNVYDEIQTGRKAKYQEKQSEKVERKPRYIAQLKKRADLREREHDLRFERRLLRERETEDHLYQDKGKYVTSAFKQKIDEQREFEQKLKREAEDEKRNDVKKRDGLGGFYSHLLEQTVGAPTLSKEETKPKSEDHRPSRSSHDRTPSSSSRSTRTTEYSRPLVGLPGIRIRLPGIWIRLPETTRDTMEQATRDTEQATRDTDHPTRDTEQAGGSSRDTSHDRLSARQWKEKFAVPNARPKKQSVPDPSQKAARRNKGTEVMSARERYMARKRAREDDDDD
eukprot:963201_1